MNLYEVNLDGPTFNQKASSIRVAINYAIDGYLRAVDCIDDENLAPRRKEISILRAKNAERNGLLIRAKLLQRDV